MADNVELDLGSGGAVVKTDDDGTAHWQYVKLAYGADNTQTRVTTAAPLPVDLRTDNLAGNLDVNLAASAATVTVDNGGTFAVQAAQSGTWNITNVSGTISLPTGAATAANQSTANTSLGNIETAVQLIDNANATISATDVVRVAIFDDSDSQITTFGGGTQYTEDAIAPTNPVGTAMMMERDDALGGLTPIEGDWTHPYATAEGALWVQDFNSDAILADTASMDTNLGTIAGAISGTEMQVDLVSADVTNAGTFAVQAAQTGTWTVDLGANNDVTIDNSSIVHAEDAVHNSGDAGIMPLAVRNDTLAALGGTDGDYSPLQVSATGALYVELAKVTNEHVDDAAFTPGSDIVAMIGATFDDTTPDSVDEGDGGAVRMSANRNLYQTIRDAAGNERGANVDASNRLTVLADLGATDNAVLDSIDSAVNGTLTVGSHAVTNAGTFAVQEDGAALTALQLIDDAIFVDDTATHTAATTKLMGIGAVATPTDTNLDANDIGMPAMSVDRRLYTDAQIVGQDVNLTVDLGATDNAVLDQLELNTSYGDNTGNGTASGSLRVSLASDSTGQVTLATGSNSIGTLGANSGVDIGDVDVTSISAGSNLIGDVGISGARTSGGTTFFYDNDLDETKVEVKNAAGQIYWFHAVNLSAAVLYLQVFNNVAASVTVGTTTPDMEFIIPTQGDTNGAGFTLAIPNGIAMGTGITVACTTNSQGNGAPGASACTLNMGYA